MECTERYLIMVTPGDNHNKYYRMIDNGSTWTAEYGRVGSAPQRRSYPMSDWNKKYNEKIRKGYVDKTDLKQELIRTHKNNGEASYKEIEDAAIREIVNRLQSMAKEVVRANYRISSEEMTQKMVDAAQVKLNELMNCITVAQFNHTLLELFTIIPRRMSNVAAFLAQKPEDFNQIIAKEQALLDTARGQVKTPVPESFADGENTAINDKTILETLGLVMEPCTVRDVALIKKNLGNNKDQFVNAWRVSNLATQKRFDKFVKDYDVEDTKLLWHGSRNENWWNIMKTGLVLRPTNVVITGKMFGYGSYFANLAKKSIGYTSLRGSYWTRGNESRGFLALMEVAYGKPYDVYASCDMTWNKLHAMGCHSLHAHAGRYLYNDEIVVYREDQMTIRYLVELRE